MSNRPIESLLVERGMFAPPEAFRARAVVSDEAIYENVRRDPDAF